MSVNSEGYAYPWNAPREAIASPYPTYEEIHRRDQMIAALLRAQAVLDKQPTMIKYDVKRRMAELEQQQGIARANAYLTKTFVERTLPRVKQVNDKYQLTQIEAKTSHLLTYNAGIDQGSARVNGALWELVKRFNRLPDMARADIDLLAGDISNFIMAELVQAHKQVNAESDYQYTHRIYITAASITRAFNQLPPLWEKVTSRLFDPEEVTPAILRMKTDRWWKTKLRRIASDWREHLHIALANVSKKHSPYASKTAISEWREQKRRTREFLKAMELQDDEGNRINLLDKYDGSVANPAIRRCELMARIRGFEDVCNQLGFVGEFYTITAPSKYHATVKTGHRNCKWNGASPSGTQSYLCSVWQRIRAKLHREELRIFGMRVAEPHHDGTPHWHMLMFMRPEDVERVRKIIGDYAYQEDAFELRSDKARKARFHAEAIDPDKGSATGYVAKYISKNIDGYALDGELDDESGKELKETAPAVSAWAARWHIRQFQFIGGAPVTVYRELRRMADKELARGLSVEFAAVHDAADDGQWADYVNAQGGPFVKRDELAVRTWYEANEELNQYGEETVRVKGVYATEVGADTPIITRLINWKIVPKRAVELAVDPRDANASPWSSVNNCTGVLRTPDSSSPGGDQKIDFNGMTKKERRRIFNRIKSDKVKKTTIKIQWPVKVEVACEKVAAQVKDLSGRHLTHGEALCLVKGAQLRIEGKLYRCLASGDLARPYLKKKGIDFAEKMKSIAKQIKNNKLSVIKKVV